MKRVLFSFIGLLLAGCNGNIVTTSLDPSKLNTPGTTVTGVPAFLPSLFYETVELRELLDDKGKSIGTAPVQCSVVKKEKVVAKPDYAHPILVSYDPGILESYTFGIELNPDGTIKAVNNTSTPDQGKTVLNLTSAAANAAKIAAADKGQSANIPPCNGGESTIEYRRFPLSGLK
jgi:hypothetical protein